MYHTSVKFFLFLCLLAIPLFSSENLEELFITPPEQISALNNQAYLVDDFINPLSGLPSLQEVDLIAKGAQDVLLKRQFISPSVPMFDLVNFKYNEYETLSYLFKNYKGWKMFPHYLLQVHLVPPEPIVRLVTPNGVTLDYYLNNSSLVGHPYGISNYAHDLPNGKFDIRNIKLEANDKTNEIVIRYPNGTKCHYKALKKALTPIVHYLLDKEVLPNGKILKYFYDNTNTLCKVESRDLLDQETYASIELCESSANRSVYQTYLGQKASFLYKKYGYSKECEKKGKKIAYKISSPKLLSHVESPFWNEKFEHTSVFLLNSKLGGAKEFKCSYNVFGHPISGYRVSSVSDCTGTLLYKIDYNTVTDKRNGSTIIEKADGTKTIVHFTKNYLISSIQQFDETKKLRKERTFTWNERNYLGSIEFKQDGAIIFKKTYSYDSFGNPILETIQGDLQGSGKTESYQIKRKYSQDGMNLLLYEENEEGENITLSYVTGTNLVLSKLTGDHSKIHKREFREYDPYLNLIAKIIDDGSNFNKDDLSDVNHRTFTRYLLRTQHPFLHMPEWIFEGYWDKGHEKLIKKIFLTYDVYGNVCQEDIYDSDGKFSYSIHKTYSPSGDLLTETNALGQIATYHYDDRRRKILAINPSQRIHKEMFYDVKDRLISEIETGDNGDIHGNEYAYDLFDRCIKKTDHLNNSTNYSYDLISDKIIKTEMPLQLGLEQKVEKVSRSSSFDSYGREVSKVDANGHQTHFSYNAYGEITEILHPNGSRESFRYTKSGKKAQHIDKEGKVTNYLYDSLGRLIKKTESGLKGELFAEENFTYNSFHLIKKKDKEGNETIFEHDGAGRKISEQFDHKKIEYTYDSLSNIATEIRRNGKNTLVISFKRDLLGRVLEKQHCDLTGKLLYKIEFSYDADGNQSTIKRFIDGKEAIEEFIYDPFHRLIKHIAPNNSIDTISYNEKYVNALGQKVRQKIFKDPEDITTTETHDPFGRVVKVETLHNEQILASREMIYDPNGNLIEQKDPVYVDGKEEGVQIIRYTYTPLNKINDFVQAFGTPESKTTSFTYTPSGKIASKTISESTLYYSYNPLGFLETLKSSDGSIDHVFKYNRLGNLLTASDSIKKLTVQREVDASGNVLREAFSTGVCIEKTYDQFDRPCSLKINGNDVVNYQYDPLYMRQVSRIDEGKLRYKHAYTQYDLNGNPTSEELLNNLGTLSSHYDLCGRLISLSTPYFCESYEYSLAGNLIQRIHENEKYSYQYDRLSQLVQEKENRYAYDSLYNRRQKNDQEFKYDASNEEIHSKYDSRGNIITKDDFQLTYDPLNQLIKAHNNSTTIEYVYDPLGRLLSKICDGKTEHYIYDQDQEIGSFNDEIKQLRLLGHHGKTVAIELEGKVFAPIVDQQRNIRVLVDPQTKKIRDKYQFSAFGELQKSLEEAAFNPWKFASKRFDQHLNLVYFGKRYYDPTLARWLSHDPAGFHDSCNLYQYLYNNPYGYIDEDGQFICAIPLIVWGAQLALPSLTAVVTSVMYTTITAAAVYGAYKISEAINNRISHYDSGYNHRYLNENTEETKEQKKKPRHTPDQEALSGLVKESGKEGVTNEEADTLLDWANEYHFPARDDRGKNHWDFGEHIHIGTKHVKIK